MGLLDTLEKIQRKPEQTRKQIMFVVLGVCMGAVFIIWVINFRYTLNHNLSANVAGANSTSPVDYIKNLFNDLKN